MRVFTVIDPGHGGSAPVGHSTPIGVAGPGGLLEKNVTMHIARQVVRRLGSGAQLTRSGDVNLSLGDRARTAQRLGARSFVSIHANGGGRGPRGVESWIHPGAGPSAAALADEVRSALRRPDVPDRGLFRGELAVLDPSLHAHDSAACLVEVDYLDDQGGARRLGDPREVASLGDSIAQAIERYLGRGDAPRRSYSFGRGVARGLDALDLTDFSDSAMVIVPDGTVDRVPADITQAELDELKRAWDCMMRGTGMRLSGSDADKRAFRGMLLGGLVYSPFLRRLFVEMACDDTRPIEFLIGRSQPGVFVDGFQYPAIGQHTIDMDDFDELPNVSGNPRNFMQLRYQILVHAMREARQGVLGNAYPAAHNTAIDDENVYRTEQGQIGAKDHAQPTVDVDGDFRFELTHNGAVALWEKWRVVGAAQSITSITYSP